MKRTTNIARVLGVAGSTLLLTACASLQDVDHLWCPPEAEPEPVAVTETVTLKADALFRFDRSGVQDILPGGRTELSQLADKLNSGYARIDSVLLEGHTDRLGSDAYNQALSQARADSVAHYLRSKGVQAPMRAVGQGEAQPVTAGCVGDRATAQLIACLQPDRRVEVQITGVANR